MHAGVEAGSSNQFDAVYFTDVQDEVLLNPTDLFDVSKKLDTLTGTDVECDANAIRVFLSSGSEVSPALASDIGLEAQAGLRNTATTWVNFGRAGLYEDWAV